MRQYKLCIQIIIVIIIIIIIIVIKKGIKVKREEIKQKETERACRREDFYFLFFLLFISFSDLRKSNRRFLLEQKAKLDYATRATRRYKYLSVSSNFKR